MKAAEVLRVALYALWQAIRRPLRPSQTAAPARFSESRRKALLKLGGACACCGLGMDFGRALEMHHVNLNGDLHRKVLRAFSGGCVFSGEKMGKMPAAFLMWKIAEIMKPRRGSRRVCSGLFFWIQLHPTSPA
jgi:hypothetical protein